MYGGNRWTLFEYKAGRHGSKTSRVHSATVTIWWGWCDASTKKYVLSQDDEDKAILSQDGEDNGLQSCDSEDSVSFSENSEEEYDDLPLLSDDEYVSQPPENSVDFFQMELDAEHTEKEQVHTNKQT